MTDDDRRDQMDRYSELLKATLAPLLKNDDAPHGIVAFRLFYAIDHGDGTLSAGNLGAAGEDHIATSALLIRTILALLVDVQGNREFDIAEAPKKS